MVSRKIFVQGLNHYTNYNSWCILTGILFFHKIFRLNQIHECLLISFWFEHVWDCCEITGEWKDLTLSIPQRSEGKPQTVWESKNTRLWKQRCRFCVYFKSESSQWVRKPGRLLVLRTDLRVGKGWKIARKWWKAVNFTTGRFFP